MKPTLALALLLGTVPAWSQAPSFETRQQVLRTLVQVTASGCADGIPRSGSGFALEQPGRIVTAHHVVGGCNTVQVSYEAIKPPQPRKREARVVRVLAAGDLSLLQIEDPPEVPVLRLAVGLPARDQAFFGFGYALGMPTAGDQPVHFSTGASRLADILPPAAADELKKSGSPIAIEREVLRFNVALQPGMSGGPIVNAAGEVIGVVAGGLKAGAAPASWGWPGEGVRRLLVSTESTQQAIRVASTYYSLQDMQQVATARDRNRRLRCGELDFVDSGARTLAELVSGADDKPRVQYILNLLRTDPRRLDAERFQVWTHLDSGATAVVPAAVTLRQDGGACVARSASGNFEQLVWGAVAAGPVGVMVKPNVFEQQIVTPRMGPFMTSQFDPHLTTGAFNPATGFYQPTSQTDANGTLFARKGLFLARPPMAGGGMGHVFETLVARNDSFLGVAIVNRDRPAMLDSCVMAPTTAMCQGAMAHLREWTLYILATQLSTYPAN